jgi:hypothetical protein
MKNTVAKIMMWAVFAATAGVQAHAKTHFRSIVVESPSDLPEMAGRTSEAMYLLELSSGQAVLYLEQDQGRTLAILDVSNPGTIQPLGQVSIAAPSLYDFVETLKDSAVLIHYRDDSGFAIIHFKKFKQPVLTEAPEFQNLTHAEAIGHDGLVLAYAVASGAPVAVPQYKVFDISNPSEPAALATIEGVRQRLERTETGTLFLLGNAGLTVIRRPAVEEEYKNESTLIIGIKPVSHAPVFRNRAISGRSHAVQRCPNGMMRAVLSPRAEATSS